MQTPHRSVHLVFELRLSCCETRVLTTVAPMWYPSWINEVFLFLYCHPNIHFGKDGIIKNPVLLHCVHVNIFDQSDEALLVIFHFRYCSVCESLLILTAAPHAIKHKQGNSTRLNYGPGTGISTTSPDTRVRASMTAFWVNRSHLIMATGLCAATRDNLNWINLLIAPLFPWSNLPLSRNVF